MVGRCSAGRSWSRTSLVLVTLAALVLPAGVARGADPDQIPVSRVEGADRYATAAVREALRRLAPDEVVVVGGPTAVSDRAQGGQPGPGR